MLNGIGVSGGVFLASLYLYKENALEAFVKGLYSTKAVDVKASLGFAGCIVGVRSVVITLILPSYSLTNSLALPSSFKERQTFFLNPYPF